MDQLPILAGSAAVVLLMIAIAAALGFRDTARLDEAAVAKLAAAEGAEAEAIQLAPNAKSALAKLSGGKLLVARVMGADISARIAPTSRARVRLKRGKLSVQFADLGFPPLHMAVQAPPPWLAALAAGEAP